MNILEDLKALPSRCDISHVLNKYGLCGTAAEIGVDMGHFATAVLAHWKGKEYLAVDLWAKQDPAVYEEVFDWDLSYRCARELAMKDSRVKLMKMLSLDAAKIVGDGSLDWIWIDANHNTQPVLDDMNAWWPKVKLGGVFSGHDFFYPGVNAAVEKWFKDNQKSFVVADSSWYTVKEV